MTDPKHPTKIVVVVEGGTVQWIGSDRAANVRVFVADYDATEEDGAKDSRGRIRLLSEWPLVIDSVDVRAILNKKGAKGETA